MPLFVVERYFSFFLFDTNFHHIPPLEKPFAFKALNRVWIKNIHSLRQAKVFKICCCNSMSPSSQCIIARRDEVSTFLHPSPNHRCIFWFWLLGPVCRPHSSCWWGGLRSGKWNWWGFFSIFWEMSPSLLVSWSCSSSLWPEETVIMVLKILGNCKVGKRFIASQLCQVCAVTKV